MLRSSTASAIGLLLSSLLPACDGAHADNDPPPVENADAKEKHSLSGHRVEVAVMELSRNSLKLSVPGEVEAYRDALLASSLGGYIERVSVAKGDRVRRGQVLVSVDRQTHAVRQGRAKLELVAAERELARTRTLAGSIPQAELDSAEDRVNLAEATLAELALNLNRALVVAPFEGMVVDVDAEVGEVAAPGTPLLRLVQLKPALVSVALSDRDIELAAVGAKAKVYVDARSGVYQGTVKSVARAADMKTRSFEAMIEVANEEEKLLPGMIANVELESAGAAPTQNEAEAAAGAPSAGASSGKIIISQDWLVTKPSGVGIFVVEDSKAVWRSVVLGEILRKQVVVEEGLTVGDTLIIVGHRDLVAGDQVLIHRKGVCCTDGRATFSE